MSDPLHIVRKLLSKNGPIKLLSHNNEVKYSKISQIFILFLVQYLMHITVKIIRKEVIAIWMSQKWVYLSVSKNKKYRIYQMVWKYLPKYYGNCLVDSIKSFPTYNNIYKTMDQAWSLCILSYKTC